MKNKKVMVKSLSALVLALLLVSAVAFARSPRLSEIGKVIYACRNSQGLLDLARNPQSGQYFVVFAQLNGEVSRIEAAEKLGSDSELYQIGSDLYLEISSNGDLIAGQLRPVDSDVLEDYSCIRI